MPEQQKPTPQELKEILKLSAIRKAIAEVLQLHKNDVVALAAKYCREAGINVSEEELRDGKKSE